MSASIVACIAAVVLDVVVTFWAADRPLAWCLCVAAIAFAGFCAFGGLGAFAFFSAFGALIFFALSFFAAGFFFSAGALAFFGALLFGVFFAGLADFETAFLIVFGMSTKEF